MTLLEQLQQLAPLAAQATAGPWVNSGEEIYGNHGECQGHPCRYTVMPMSNGEHGPAAAAADLAFIAAARNVLTPENLRIIRACVKVVTDSQPHV